MQTFNRKMMEEKIRIFGNRREELDNLNESLNSLVQGKPRHFVIIGPRRIGKTHLAIKYGLGAFREGAVPIYVDCLFLTSWAEVANAIVESAIGNYVEFSGKKIDADAFLVKAGTKVSDIISAIKSVEAEIGSEAGQYLTLRVSMEKKSDEIDLLRKALRLASEFAEKKDVRFIAILDEIQHAAKFESCDEGFAAIRSEMQFQSRIQFIFSGSSPTFMRENFLGKSAALWKQVTPFEMGEFTVDGVEEIIKKMNPKAKFGDTESKLLHDLTHGMPDYVVKTLESIQGAEVDSLDPERIRFGFGKVIESEARFVEYVLDQIPVDQLKVLNAIASGKKSYRDIAAMFKYPPTMAIRDLERDEILKKEGRGRYSIRDPIVEKVLSKSITEERGCG